MSSNPPPGPPYHTTTNFAALRAGPGNVKPVHGSGSDEPGTPGVTTHRVLTKDRTFVDELHYKGWSLKLADWVHLSNPDDPSRPIIGQVFRCWVSEEM
jgi:chromatin structure-remodeling complex subunit RSC1/2